MEYLEGYNNNLKNRLYGLLCEREKEGEWQKFLDSIVIELMSYPEENRTINYYRLYTKVASLRYLNYLQSLRHLLRAIRAGT